MPQRRARPSFALPALLTAGILLAQAFAAAPLSDPLGAPLPEGLYLALPWSYLLAAPLFTLWDGVSMLSMHRLEGFLAGLALLYVLIRAGLGLARLMGPASLGVDFIYEPMFSKTWADAARDTLGPGGGTVRAGARTVENHFRFANSKLRLGLGWEHRRRRDSSVVAGFQVGLALGSVNYRLRQRDFVQGTSRTQDESWMEWVPTVGWHYSGRDLEFMYTARMTCLSGSECVPWPMAGGDDVSIAAPVPVNGGGVIVAPAAPLTFRGGRAIMHRVMFRVPIR